MFFPKALAPYFLLYMAFIGLTSSAQGTQLTVQDLAPPVQEMIAQQHSLIEVTQQVARLYMQNPKGLVSIVISLAGLGYLQHVVNQKHFLQNKFNNFFNTARELYLYNLDYLKTIEKKKQTNKREQEIEGQDEHQVEAQTNDLEDQSEGQSENQTEQGITSQIEDILEQDQFVLYKFWIYYLLKVFPYTSLAPFDLCHTALLLGKSLTALSINEYLMSMQLIQKIPKVTRQFSYHPKLSLSTKLPKIFCSFHYILLAAVLLLVVYLVYNLYKSSSETMTQKAWTSNKYAGCTPLTSLCLFYAKSWFWLFGYLIMHILFYYVELLSYAFGANMLTQIQLILVLLSLFIEQVLAYYLISQEAAQQRKLKTRNQPMRGRTS